MRQPCLLPHHIRQQHYFVPVFIHKMKPALHPDYQLDEKLNLYIAAIIKDEYSGLLEWIAYHRVLGVTGFMIADNGSRDGSTEP